MREQEILEGLQSGRTLNVQRKDDPNLPFILKLQEEGKVTIKIVQLEEQSSVMKVKWIKK